MSDDEEQPGAAAPPRRPSPDLKAVARRILGEPALTPIDMSNRTAIPLERLRRTWRALGFPPVPDDERFFTPADVRVLELLAAAEGAGLYSEEEILQISRVMGQGLARVAETNVALIVDHIERARLPRAFELLEASEPFLAYVWRRHLISALGRWLAVDPGADSSARELVVGFADLVGFTNLSQEVDGRRLAALVDRFEAIVYEHIPENRGRVIKMIGDEVMFAAEDPRDAAEIALGLVDAHRADAELPEIRVGLAMGDVLSWEGDLFGPTVNLASRLVQHARPSTVLIGPNVAARLAGAPGLSVRPLRRQVRFKGLPKTTVALLARAA